MTPSQEVTPVFTTLKKSGSIFRWVQVKSPFPGVMCKIIKRGYKRLTSKQKKAILEMWKGGAWKQAELAEMFSCSPGRVSQLVNDVYGEHERLGVEVEE